MDVNSGHRLVLHDFIVVTYLTCYFFTVFVDHVLYAFNVVCRTPIRHVSSSNGWTRTHAHVAVQQHHLSMKGLPDIRPRPQLQEMKGMRLMQGKQKHGSSSEQRSARLKKLSSHSGLPKTRSISIGQLYFSLGLWLAFILYCLLLLGAMAIHDCVCHDPLTITCVM